jgi:transcriptional regulator with XRE-family HTH domain
MPKEKRPPAPLPSDVFAAELASTRERKHLTQQQLSDRLEDIGSPIDRSTIGKIEAGKRGVSIDELFAFATALGVSPMSLTVPRSDAQMRVAPNREALTVEVVQWARNMSPLPFDPDFDDPDYRFFEDAVTDSEARGYRRHPNFRTLVKLMSNMQMFAGSEEPYAKKAMRGLLVKADETTQRIWEDLDEQGQPKDVARETKLSLEKATAALYADLRKNEGEK